MSQLCLLLLCLTMVDSFVVVKIYPNAIYEPHSTCGFIRNMTWPQPASIQSCIWECVHEQDCQTAVFHKTENNCSLFVELCSIDRVLTAGIFSASTICYRKDHDPMATCPSVATTIGREEKTTTMKTKDLGVSSSSSITKMVTASNKNVSELSQTETTFPTLTTPRIPRNLLRNPGGESGNLSAWTQLGPSYAEIDKNATFKNNYYPFLGNYCFVGGDTGGGSYSRLGQNVNLLSGLQNFTLFELDSTALRVNVSFHYQTNGNNNNNYDFPDVSITFKNITNDWISTINASVPICSTSPGIWCNQSAQHSLPATTRSIYYTMIFFKGNNNKIAAYVDENSLTIY